MDPGPTSSANLPKSNTPMLQQHVLHSYNIIKNSLSVTFGLLVLPFAPSCIVLLLNFLCVPHFIFLSVLAISGKRIIVHINDP